MAERRKRPAPPAVAGALYASVLKTGFQATTTRVQEMHHAIADKTFDALQQLPGLSGPARLVHGAHDAITHGVYAAVRQGGAAALTLAGVAERLTVDPSRQPVGKELALRSALNATVGDALLDAGSGLAIQMGFHAEGAPLLLTRNGLANLGERVCVFVHGLGCDEHSWSASAGRADYAALLAVDLGMSAIYLRYNSGLPLADNARQFAALLQRLTKAAPRLRELVLIGHSMGGLVARGACECASADGSAWLDRVRMVICLGTPHQGAPLEKIGRWVSKALAVSDVTRPLGRIANSRSQGIKDLRDGLQDRVGRPLSRVPLRFVVGHLGDASDGVLGSAIGTLLGDGLVRSGSASDDGLSGDVRRVELAGLGHMALLNEPRVYAVIRDWLRDAPRA
ncbi:MAG: alpha/beta hydrolase [Betaproteobacteria bacterium]|nr:MAG: alpha/beta hydrolase [Betaproteobacteria bacterium]